jgi:hypothetical protein
MISEICKWQILVLSKPDAPEAFIRSIERFYIAVHWTENNTRITFPTKPIATEQAEVYTAEIFKMIVKHTESHCSTFMELRANALWWLSVTGIRPGSALGIYLEDMVSSCGAGVTIESIEIWITDIKMHANNV